MLGNAVLLRPESQDIIDVMQKCATTTGYLQSHMMLDPEDLAPRVEMSIKNLAGVEFDTIAFSGISGAIVAPMIALWMNKHLLLVRKKNDDTHSRLMVEGYYGVKKFIVVDDFVSSGTTLRRILEATHQASPVAEFVGVLSYTSACFSYAGEFWYILQRAGLPKPSNP